MYDVWKYVAGGIATLVAAFLLAYLFGWLNANNNSDEKAQVNLNQEGYELIKSETLSNLNNSLTNLKDQLDSKNNEISDLENQNDSLQVELKKKPPFTGISRSEYNVLADEKENLEAEVKRLHLELANCDKQVSYAPPVQPSQKKVDNFDEIKPTTVPDRPPQGKLLVTTPLECSLVWGDATAWAEFPVNQGQVLIPAKEGVGLEINGFMGPADELKSDKIDKKYLDKYWVKITDSQGNSIKLDPQNDLGFDDQGRPNLLYRYVNGILSRHFK